MDLLRRVVEEMDDNVDRAADEPRHAVPGFNSLLAQICPDHLGSTNLMQPI